MKIIELSGKKQGIYERKNDDTDKKFGNRNIRDLLKA
jgi:hypothetical protein